MEYIETAKWLIETVAAVTLAVTPVLYMILQRQRFDLEKTLKAAEDVGRAISNARDTVPPNVIQAMNDGVAEVERLRGKKLSPKLKRKAMAKIEAQI